MYSLFKIIKTKKNIDKTELNQIYIVRTYKKKQNQNIDKSEKINMNFKRI